MKDTNEDLKRKNVSPWNRDIILKRKNVYLKNMEVTSGRKNVSPWNTDIVLRKKNVYLRNMEITSGRKNV